jgi:1-phosphofructokinase
VLPATTAPPDPDAPTGVCVFGPSTIVTVTVETGEDDADEIHLHAGGQGFWVARLLGRLGVPVTLCSVFGGESGRVARALVEDEQIDVRAVGRQAPNGAYVHDRRGGERREVAESGGAPLSRHDVDELYGAALATAMEVGICVLTGPHSPDVLGGEIYRRLAGDLRRNGVTVVADLSGAHLLESLQGGVDFCKVSEDDLVRDGLAPEGPDAAALGLRRLLDGGAEHAAVTRADEPLLAAVDGEWLEVTAPRFESLDHRGAGDSFTALAAACRFWGLSWRDGLAWGAAAGALTATRRGLATADRRDLHRLVPRVQLRPAPAAGG